MKFGKTYHLAFFFISSACVVSCPAPFYVNCLYTFLRKHFYANHPVVVEHYVNQYKGQQILLCNLREF